MHVVRDRPHVVEELAKQIPAALSRHDAGPKQQIARCLDGRPEQESIRAFGPHIAQPFVFQRGRPIGRLRG